MLFQDWDIELIGKRIRITPMRIEDDPVYGRLLLGDLYKKAIDMNVLSTRKTINISISVALCGALFLYFKGF